ncbi:MAG: hypothetical protein IJM54_03830 [Thermoguttaceae bacterium]|nr:hypothetical protein [Thermoguttaceae bacterium]
MEKAAGKTKASAVRRPRLASPSKRRTQRQSLHTNHESRKINAPAAETGSIVTANVMASLQ